LIIEPIIDGVIARTAHPFGCREAILQQIAYVKQTEKIHNGPKKILVLGASSGFGLASRIAFAFGGPNADSIGVSFEKGPSDKRVGTAGWYNNIFFQQEAKHKGLIAKDFIGDAFSPEIRQNVIHYIQTEFGGEVDTVIYSLATGIRPDHKTGKVWRSSLKPIGSSYKGRTINLEKECLDNVEIESATPNEISQTIKVMGGDDWKSWIEELSEAGVLAEGCQTFAYSYIGPEITYPIYRDGTLGQAKKNLHTTADELNGKLSAINGQAHIAVCKALVTKASVFIPAFSEYMIVLYKIMKEKGIHENGIMQMQRLFSKKVFGVDRIDVDDQRLIRMDDWEMRKDVQHEVKEWQKQLTPDNFKQIGDFSGYFTDFLQLNGFSFNNVDYNQPIDINDLKKLSATLS